MELSNQGVIYSLNWGYCKLIIGAMVVSLGYSLPSGIYMVRRIPTWLKVIIQLTVGTLVFIIVGYICDWLIPGRNNMLIIIGQLVVAFLYLVITYFYNVKLADKINMALK